MLNPNTFGYLDPFAAMQAMMRDLDRTFTSAIAPTQPVFPPVNIWQGEEAVAITAELPGVEPSDVDISVEGDMLTISGKREAPELDGANWHRNERVFGSFRRTIRLPFEIDESKVEARVQDGTLRLLIGRPDTEKPRKIRINAN